MADKEIQLFGDTAFCALHTEKDGGVVRIQRRATAFERDLTERFGDGIALTGKGALPSVLRRFGSEHRHAAAGCRAVYADCADEQALVKLRRAARSSERQKERK